MLERLCEFQLDFINRESKSISQMISQQIGTNSHLRALPEKPLHDHVDVYKETIAVESESMALDTTRAGYADHLLGHRVDSRHRSSNRDPFDADVQSLGSKIDNDGEDGGPISGDSISEDFIVGDFEQRRFIETVVAQALATDLSLRSLQEGASRLLPQDCYINNFQRLLSDFCDEILESSPELFSQNLAACLRDMDSRTRIARDLMDEQLNCDEIQNNDKSRVQRLSTTIKSEPNSNFRLNVEQASDLPQGEERQEGQASASLPGLDLVIQALVQGQPFRNLILEFQYLLLPHELLKELLPIPESHIGFEPPSKSSITNKIQGWFETVTTVDWDWWPLSPWLPPLEHNETRVFWRCVRYTRGTIVHDANFNRLAVKCDGAC
jgi:hypothetical protein